ncbi:hypothetical protein CPB83DRAFT_887182 [Crepidotus variabilis]|uniref:Uncharacterized protein n=1 Tax=Crepidotus variabilis TaxID=179855 RepID=A0A9P6E5T8_9AGAR|nr:hypothetical protein CPB83DRAFT_887182 [Crepidotus variabilis]
MPFPSPVVTTTSTTHSTLSKSSSSTSLSPPITNTEQNGQGGGSRTPTFDDHNEILHRVEFDAPLSSGPPQPLSEGRFSIDFSLELERQLATMESPPVTPAFNVTTHAESGSMGRSFTNDTGEGRSEHGPNGHAVKGSGMAYEGVESNTTTTTGSGDLRDLLPDPEVLAHIITQLRHSLADMTKERDDLLKMLGNTTAEEANVKDALQLMTEKATQAEEDLTEAKKKIREDEEQIVLLRAKVEESRRGVMRLQTESRRQSMAPIDVNRASSVFSGFSSPPNKRASFTPLTGSKNGHRRISSVSDSNVLAGFLTPDLTPSPNGSATFSLTPATPATDIPPNNSRRISTMMGRHSPPDSGLLHSMSTAESQVQDKAELESLKADVKTLKDELEHVKHDLAEANEAKEASETCVKALREFIAENNIGASAVKLPPPPTMTNGEESPAEPKKTGSGWGFKLWGSGSGGGSTIVDSPMKSAAPLPHSAAPMDTPSTPATRHRSTSPPGDETPTTTVGPAPLSRKLTGLFSSRSSVSSVGKEQPVLPPLSMTGVPPRMSQRDSVYSYSDASTLAEPISPGSDINGLGIPGYVGMKGQPGVINEEEDMMAKNLDSPLTEVDLNAMK